MDCVVLVDYVFVAFSGRLEGLEGRLSESSLGCLICGGIEKENRGE